jgi:hypothetical protein
MHYLQVRPHRTLSVSITEGVMVNAPLELRFLNPFTVFHSYESYKTYTDYNDNFQNPKEGINPENGEPYTGNETVMDTDGTSRIGSYLGVKLEWQPVKYFRLYGLYVMDQLQLGYEQDNHKDKLTPNAQGFQAGAELSLPVKDGYLSFGLEGVYTQPYLYAMWNRRWSFYKASPDILTGPKYWTGTPFGPDTIAGAFKAGYRALNRKTPWALNLSLSFAAQGERSNLAMFNDDEEYEKWRPTPAVFDVTVPPTGTPVFTYTAALRGEWEPYPWLTLAAQPGYLVVANNGHVKGETVHGAEFVVAAKLVLPSKRPESN